MPRKLSLSPTKISTFLACPVKYWYTYCDPRGKLYLRSKSYYSFGSTLHRVLEQFHDEGNIGVTTTESALAAYEEAWIDAGYESADEMADFFGEGKEIIVRYVEEELRKPKVGRTLFTEKSIQADFGSFRLIGRVDRIDEVSPTHWVIVDYKSGRQTVTEDSVRQELAMGIYQLILKKAEPDKTVDLRIIALRSGNSATTSLSQSELEQLEQDVIRIAEQLATIGPEDYVPTYKPLCEGCDFRRLCNQNPAYRDTIPAETLVSESDT